jgi:hypothetical protein
VYIQPVTLQVVEFSVHDGQLVIGRTNGRVLLPLAQDLFRVQGETVEYAFGSGEHAGFELRPLGPGKAVQFEWRAPAVAAAAALTAYAGDYFSEELNARYRVTATDSTIELRTDTSEPRTARMVFGDTFLAGGYTIQFVRRQGRPAGFEITDGRVRRVRFERVAR